MTVDELPEYLKQHGLEIGEQLRNGTYQPQPVRRVEIPKPDGNGVRKLGIPCVLDRFASTQTQGKPGEERRGPTGAKEVSRIQFHQRAKTAASNRPQGHRPL